jgi:hypothetical protein
MQSPEQLLVKHHPLAAELRRGAKQYFYCRLVSHTRRFTSVHQWAAYQLRESLGKQPAGASILKKHGVSNNVKQAI